MVGRQYDVQAINTAARDILGIHYATAVGQDFVHLARGIQSEELRGVIDRAFQGRAGVERVQLTCVADMVQDVREIEISCFPQRAGDSLTSRVAIVLSDEHDLRRTPPFRGIGSACPGPARGLRGGDP